MWHHAAAHEEEFLSSSDCQDIIEIIRSYDLRPHVPCSRCFTSFHTIRISKPVDREDDPSSCRCGSDSNIEPFTWSSGVKNKIIYDEKVKMEKTSKEKLPVFSSNRSAITPSEYGGQ
ncbi:hypothetical protein NPIL_37041 [Nephila pilipes]|uniref:Uncharacterized protein n=1 Tax=Nephila pilipes TaxID=299642 RepID=A0A8X6UAM0_NEPPI|nr:hypothetical protein NPIL_37041 [Nephila pilipes]